MEKSVENLQFHITKLEEIKENYQNEGLLEQVFFQRERGFEFIIRIKH